MLKDCNKYVTFIRRIEVYLNKIQGGSDETEDFFCSFSFYAADGDGTGEGGSILGKNFKWKLCVLFQFREKTAQSVVRKPQCGLCNDKRGNLLLQAEWKAV